MKKLLLLAAVALLSASSAQALEPRIIKQLNALAPQERREQRCDMEAMSRIRQSGDYRPDKVIAYAFGDTIAKGNLVRAPGAVFRSSGEWYRLKFDCETGEKGLEVRTFGYKIGSKVPREQWEKHNLYE